MIRRYKYGDIERICQKLGLQKLQTVSISFGPPTLWRKPISPISFAISLSETLVRLSTLHLFNFLAHFANHWVIGFEKPPCPEGFKL
jgi:hypothetical protein